MLLLDVFALAIPVEPRPDGEAMTEVVHAWPGTITWAPQPDLSGQSPEDAMNVLMLILHRARGRDPFGHLRRQRSTTAPRLRRQTAAC